MTSVKPFDVPKKLLVNGAYTGLINKLAGAEGTDSYPKEIFIDKNALNSPPSGTEIARFEVDKTKTEIFSVPWSKYVSPEGEKVTWQGIENISSRVDIADFIPYSAATIYYQGVTYFNNAGDHILDVIVINGILIYVTFTANQDYYALYYIDTLSDSPDSIRVILSSPNANGFDLKDKDNNIFFTKDMQIPATDPAQLAKDHVVIDAKFNPDRKSVSILNNYYWKVAETGTSQGIERCISLDTTIKFKVINNQDGSRSVVASATLDIASPIASSVAELSAVEDYAVIEANNADIVLNKFGEEGYYVSYNYTTNHTVTNVGTSSSTQLGWYAEFTGAISSWGDPTPVVQASFPAGTEVVVDGDTETTTVKDAAVLDSNPTFGVNFDALEPLKYKQHWNSTTLVYDPVSGDLIDTILDSGDIAISYPCLAFVVKKHVVSGSLSGEAKGNGFTRVMYLFASGSRSFIKLKERPGDIANYAESIDLIFYKTVSVPSNSHAHAASMISSMSGFIGANNLSERRTTSATGEIWPSLVDDSGNYYATMGRYVSPVGFDNVYKKTWIAYGSGSGDLRFEASQLDDYFTNSENALSARSSDPFFGNLFVEGLIDRDNAFSIIGRNDSQILAEMVPVTLLTELPTDGSEPDSIMEASLSIASSINMAKITNQGVYKLSCLKDNVLNNTISHIANEDVIARRKHRAFVQGYYGSTEGMIDPLPAGSGTVAVNKTSFTNIYDDFTLPIKTNDFLTTRAKLTTNIWLYSSYINIENGVDVIPPLNEAIKMWVGDDFGVVIENIEQINIDGVMVNLNSMYEIGNPSTARRVIVGNSL